MLRLYNTATRKIEEFRPLHPPHVGVYSCGPTVYWNQHIGHMYAYVQWDVLVRFLRFLWYKVKWVMNITDVGHLSSDADEGEDKMEKGAKREGLTVWQVADKYIRQFEDSLTLLNIQRPDVLCRATEHIREQLVLLRKMEERGFTYKTSTGLVFDTGKFPDYAKFARLNLEKQQAGKRVAVAEGKKNPWDFLLWVTNQPRHLMQWDSPWGRGFPGWHLECTAMSTKYLGELFDIHTGGKEHIPVHHTNEIAQAYGAFGHPTVAYWLHNEWLTIKGEKMSKALGNFYTVQELVAKGYDPLSLRYLILNSHYRTGLNFSFASLDGAQQALRRLRQEISSYPVSSSASPVGCAEYEQRFNEVLAEDLNVPQAVGLVWELLGDEELPPVAKRVSLERWEKVLGLGLGKPWTELELAVPEAVALLVEEREKARREGEFAQADALRREIESQGFVVEDTAAGPRLKKAPRPKVIKPEGLTA
jgi:cysteinyl-tRNA synthetase